MTLSFRTKLLVSYLGLVAFVIAVTTFELNRSLGADLVRQLDERLIAQTDGAMLWIGAGRHPNRLAGRLASVVGAEIALIDKSGTVLGYADARQSVLQTGTGADSPDSKPPSFPDQNDQPEVKGARAAGRGFATRLGNLPTRTMRYVAVSNPEGLVLRLGVPLSGVEETLTGMRRRLLFAALLAMVVAVALALLASRVISGPLRAMADIARKMAEGDFKAQPPSNSPDELGALAKALSSMGSQLEARITDLTSERDRLTALLGQVRKLEVVRRDFVANLSHELRTPVTAIQGYSETLLTCPTEPATREKFLTIIHRNAERVGRLLGDLLQLSSIEAAPESFEPEPIVLSALAGLVAQTVEERRVESSAQIDVEILPDLTAMGDAGRLEQVVENLVDNALKHGGKGVRIRLTGAKHNGQVELRVSDNGPGIAAEHLPRIFERFYRVDPARSREKGGAGLGLAIVKHLVEGMGGNIQVESRVGEGTTFVVTLPAA
ncbi:MAG: HAMP domain-containing protein [Polyangiaceae bacterium]|nr:HAMP domain-containing protein [Polyangiaceae bacterium]